MAKYLFAHNSANHVKLGDKVKAYDNYIGEIGNANGAWYSHLHYSVSVGLSIAQIKAYINGWSVAKVKEFYREPDIDRDKMFEKPVDSGQAGYDWLQTINNGSPHPGIDYNGFGGGDSDYGYKFKSPVDGEVIFAGDWGKNWGKVIIIDDNTMSEYKIDSKLRKAIEAITETSYDDKLGNEEVQEEAARDLNGAWESIVKERIESIDENAKLNRENIRVIRDKEKALNNLNALKLTSAEDIRNLKDEVRIGKEELEECVEYQNCPVAPKEYSWGEIIKIVVNKIKSIK